MYLTVFVSLLIISMLWGTEIFDSEPYTIHKHLILGGLVMLSVLFNLFMSIICISTYII